MSRTQQKNGKRVEEAADKLSLEGEGHYYLRVTVAQVAREAGVSKPTAQKYLDMLVSHGTYIEEKRDMRYCAKNTPKTYRFAKHVWS